MINNIDLYPTQNPGQLGDFGAIADPRRRGYDATRFLRKAMNRVALALAVVAMLPVFACHHASVVQAQSDPLNNAYKPAVDCTPADYPSNIALSGPLVKLRQDAGTPSGVYGAAPCITIMAVQNEFADFQVHVQGPSGGYSALNITMSALTKSTGPGNSFTIPAPSASATNIIVYKELYMDVTIQTGASATFYNSPGYYPDALLPAIDPYYHQTTNAFPVSIASGKNQSAWVDVLVPQTAPSGWYSGTVTISNGSSTLATMPVVLGVWQWPTSVGGYMPSTTTLRSWTGVSYDGGCIQMFGSLSACNYGGKTGDAATALVREDATTLLLDNRYSNGGGLTNTFPCNSSGVCGSFSNWDAAYAPYFNGTNGHVPGVLQGAKLTSFSLNNNMLGNLSTNGGTFAAFQQHFAANGWPGLFYYLCDEPAPAGGGTPITTCITNGELEHTFTSPVVPNLVTTNYPFLSTYTGGLTTIDWMVPTITDLDPPGGPMQNLSQYAAWVAAEPKVRQWWSYLACSSAGTCGNGTIGKSNFSYPNYDVDGLPVANRVMEWLTFKHGQTAELYYAADVCAQTGTGPSNACGVYSGGPSTSPHNTLVSDYYSGGWGDGTLIYYTGVSYNGGTTIPLILASMRLKMIRDGMQDYEYLNLLTNQGKGSFVQSEISSWITNSYTFTVSPSGITAARQALGTAIHQLTYSSTLQPPPTVNATLQ